MSAKANNKELLQCFVLAYIQKYPNATEEDFRSYFAGITLKKDLELFGKKYYKNEPVTQILLNEINRRNSLEYKKKPKEREIWEVKDITQRNGNFNPVKEFTNELGTFPLGKIKNYRPSLTVKSKNMVWSLNHQISTCFISGAAFYDNVLSRQKTYAFLNQDDPFVLEVKDKPLKKIKSVMNFSGNVDLLSPVDFFAVEISQKSNIIETMKSMITEAKDSDILDNMRHEKGIHSYRGIMNEYFQDEVLVGISSKVLGKSIPRTFKVVNTTHIKKQSILGTVLEEHMDIFTKLLRLIEENMGNMDYIIDRAIQFKQVHVRPTMKFWSIDVKMDVSAVSHSEKDISLFQLEFLGDKAGYNGKFYKTQELAARTISPFVGGLSNKTELSRLFFQEYGYGFPKEDFFKRRIATATNKEFVKFLEKPMIYTVSDVVNKMDALKFTPDQKREYMVDATIAMLGTNYNGDKASFVRASTEKIKDNWRNAELMYFLGIGDRHGEMILKKKIFLTIFGVITKTGYITFEPHVLRGFIREKLSKLTNSIPQQTVLAEFRSSPYVVLGSLL